MVAIIVVAVMIASVLRARYHRSRAGDGISAEERAETLRLRDEIKALKERIQTLERITVDKENSLARQIEELRDKP
jgi:phage shock protein B